MWLNVTLLDSYHHLLGFSGSCSSVISALIILWFSFAELPLNLSVKKWRFSKYPSTLLFGTSCFDKPWSQLCVVEMMIFSHLFCAIYTPPEQLQFWIGVRRKISKSFVLFLLSWSHIFFRVYPNALALPLLLIAFFHNSSFICHYYHSIMGSLSCDNKQNIIKIWYTTTKIIWSFQKSGLCTNLYEWGNSCKREV